MLKQDPTQQISYVRKTEIISGNLVRKYANKSENRTDSLSDTDHTKVALFIHGMVERIDFSKTPIITLGRFDRRKQSLNQVDLESFGGVDRGVSRQHCQLEFKDNQLIVTDLGSSNGTFVTGNRLLPHKPHVLKKGEELTLGRLPIQIISGR